MFASLGDVGACAKAALELWKYGWSKARNASDQYNDFGRDVQLLYQNLVQLKNVFRKVEESSQKLVPMNSEFYDTSALNSILDDPFSTIAECKELLIGRISYSGQTSPIQNLIWNFAIEAEVTSLHNRIKAHNVKILALLKPLEIKLMLDVKNLVQGYGEAILTQVAALEARIFGELSPNMGPRAIRCNEIIIPVYLIKKFDNASTRGNPDLQYGDVFPMREGIDAFLSHHKADPFTSAFSGYNILLPTQTPEQYIRMMKATWIIQRIQALPEYLEACRSGNRLLQCFIDGLALKCVEEFKRFAQEPPGDPFKVRDEPSQAVLNSMGDDAFSIWPKRVKQLDRFAQASMNERNVILRASLKHQNPGRRKEFVLSYQKENFLALNTKESSSINRSTESYEQQINLQTVSIQPIYADPNNVAETKTISMSTFGSGAIHEQLHFQSYKALYPFQEAITGYKVVKDLLKVQVTIQEDRVATKWAARVQLWTASGTSSSLSSTLAPSTLPSQSTATLTPLYNSSRRHSQATITSSSPTSGSASHHTSLHSNLTQITQLSAITSMTESEVGQGFDGLIINQPLPPQLVLFLRPQRQPRSTESPTSLTLLRIYLQENTFHLSKSSCRCPSSSKAQCVHSELAGAKRMIGTKPLLVHRYTNAQKLNLALLGAHHEHKDRVMETRISFLSMTFKTPVDRAEFDVLVPQLARLERIEGNAYERKKGDLRMGRVEGFS